MSGCIHFLKNVPICCFNHSVMQVLVPQRQRWVKHQQFVWKKQVYLFRFSSRISTPLLLLMLLSSDLMDSNAAFTSAATDLSQLFSKLQRNPAPQNFNLQKKEGKRFLCNTRVAPCWSLEQTHGYLQFKISWKCHVFTCSLSMF